ncbi:MAG TPA: hypothetical protein GXZ70_08850, partial [Clostridiales bacterium]|nr:hypothetical protein [Clostridiales bacterium]
MDINKRNSLLLSVLSIFCVSIFPVIFLYTQNAGEVNAKELILPLGIFLGIALIIGIIFSFFIKSINNLSLITCLFMLLFSNYALIEKGIRCIFSSLRYWHIAPIMIVVFLHVAYFLNKKIKIETVQTFSLVLTIVFGGLTLFNVLLAIPVIGEKIEISYKNKNQNLQISRPDNIILPNFYY